MLKCAQSRQPAVDRMLQGSWQAVCLVGGNPSKAGFLVSVVSTKKEKLPAPHVFSGVFFVKPQKVIFKPQKVICMVNCRI